MTNNVIRMPSYDSSPNLYNLTATYNTRVDPNVIVTEGGSCIGLGPAGTPQGTANWYKLDNGHIVSTSSSGYLPGYHCLLQARNWGARAILPAVDLSAYDLPTTKLRATYNGHLPTGTPKTVSFVVDPNVSGEVFRDGGNTGKNHMTTISFNAATKQFTLENRSYGWGNCKTIDCGGLVMPKLSLQAYKCPVAAPPTAEPETQPAPSCVLMCTDAIGGGFCWQECM